LEDEAVISEKIATNAIGSRAIGSNCISDVHVVLGGIGAKSIAFGSIDTTKLAVGSVSSENIKEGNVISSKLDRNCIINSKIADDAITNEKIKNSAITGSKIKDNTIVDTKLASYSVKAHALADASVSTRALSEGCVTVDKMDPSARAIAPGAVTSPSISPSSIITRSIQDDAITNKKLAGNSVNNRHIHDDAVTENKIASNSVAPKHLTQSFTLPVSKGGTGQTSAPLGSVFYGNGSDTLVPTTKELYIKNGNVGFGTKFPNYTVDVSGDLRLTGSLLNGMGLPISHPLLLEVDDTDALDISPEKNMIVLNNSHPGGPVVDLVIDQKSSFSGSASFDTVALGDEHIAGHYVSSYQIDIGDGLTLPPSAASGTPTAFIKSSDMIIASVNNCKTIGLSERNEGLVLWLTNTFLRAYKNGVLMWNKERTDGTYISGNCVLWGGSIVEILSDEGYVLNRVQMNGTQLLHCQGDILCLAGVYVDQKDIFDMDITEKIPSGDRLDTEGFFTLCYSITSGEIQWQISLKGNVWNYADALDITDDKVLISGRYRSTVPIEYGLPEGSIEEEISFIMMINIEDGAVRWTRHVEQERIRDIQFPYLIGTISDYGFIKKLDEIGDTLLWAEMNCEPRGAIIPLAMHNLKVVGTYSRGTPVFYDIREKRSIASLPKSASKSSFYVHYADMGFQTYKMPLPSSSGVVKIIINTSPYTTRVSHGLNESDYSLIMPKERLILTSYQNKWYV
jgi:hypothetical protein